MEMPSITVCGIDHVALNVRDLALMTAFYSEVLGCRVDHRQDGIGLVHLRAGPLLIDLIDENGPLGSAGAVGTPSGKNLNHLCFRVSAFEPDAARDLLVRHGVETGPIRDRYGSNGSARTLYFRDPEGNGLELRS